MDVAQLRRLKPELTKFLNLFDACFPRKDTRAHLPVYISGQLSNLPRKSVEPIAIEADVAPRTLQEFLSQHRWPEDHLRDRFQQLVGDEHSGLHSIAIIDETSFVKKGDKTPGVKRQWCGAAGKKENCIVTVHLGYACDDFHCLLDGELYLPEDWAKDPERRQQAGIPENMSYRSKWQIALELYDRAMGNGLHFEWMTFDEWYGGKPGFLRGLSARGQHFVGEVPRNLVGWLKPPRVVTRAFRRHGRGRGRKVPRLVSGSAGATYRRTAEAEGAEGPALAAVAGQGRREGADDLGDQALPVHPQGRGRSARRADAFDRGSRRLGPRGDQILRQQRTAGDVDPADAVGGFLALEGGTLFRGP